MLVNFYRFYNKQKNNGGVQGCTNWIVQHPGLLQSGSQASVFPKEICPKQLQFFEIVLQMWSVCYRG